MGDGEGPVREPQFLTEMRVENGVFKARVFRAGEPGPVALLAFVPSSLGHAALRELLRLAIEGGLVADRER
jgi:hypothetical protein